MEANDVLKHRMADLGLTRSELAHRLNEAVESQFGYYGTISERTIHLWTSGRSRTPQAKQRRALVQVFGCTLEELGFHPPSHAAHRCAPQEDPVKRRTFLTVAAATAALPVPAPTMVGGSDVIRLRTNLDDLIEIDDEHGGHDALERAALAGAARGVEMQRLGATERVRQRLFTLSADFAAIAAFSCVDAHALGRAEKHLNHASVLAGLSRNSIAQLKVWVVISMLAHHQHRPTDAIAAARAAQATAAARNDPLLASLAHARTAIGHADNHDRQSALRSLGNAHDALDRAIDKPRPSWTGFYGRAEVKSLAAVVYQQLGEPEHAETASHHGLALIPTHFRRNRAQMTAVLAYAQLQQGDIDQACSSAYSAIDLMAGNPLTGRMRTIFGDFHRELLTRAPRTAAARQWTDRARQEWNKKP